MRLIDADELKKDFRLNFGGVSHAVAACEIIDRQSTIDPESLRRKDGGLTMKPIVDRIGLPALLEQTAEECTELAHACLKEARRLRGENPTPKTKIECWMAIVEEMADIKICLNMLEEAGFCSNLDLVDKKRRRMAQRLDEAGK